MIPSKVNQNMIIYITIINETYKCNDYTYPQKE